jgi:hypothetical protein
MTDFNDRDESTINQCLNYILNNYGDDWVPVQPFPNSLRDLNTNQLNWNGRKLNTYTWCRRYILKHTGELPSYWLFNDRRPNVENDVAPHGWGCTGFGCKGGRKQQSKRKNFKLRKVSKKY